MGKPCVLVVDDDDILGPRLRRAFGDRGHEAFYADSGRAALSLSAQESPDWVVLDLRMPDMSGLAVLQALKEADPTVSVVMLTGYGSIANAVDAMRLGAVGYVQKPAHADEIILAFARSTDPSAQLVEDHHTPSLARAEWEHINRVLTDCGGNISQAARVLGIHRRSLQRKLQKYPPQI